MRPTDLRLLVLSAMLVPAAAAPPSPEPPRLGVIDFYGVRRVPVERLRKALGVKEGDILPSSKGEVEDRLEAVPGVVRVRLEATCCEEGKAILYVGIEEKGATPFELRPDPERGTILPHEIHVAYHGFLIAVAQAVQRGETGEDLTRGHSLMADQGARAWQQEFVGLAEKHLDVLRTILRDSADEEQRAIAAYVIGYAPVKRLVVDDLQYAMRDPDPTVRSNAMRALAAISVLAARDPELGIQVSTTWFVEMLNSLYWTDRNNAAVALVNFTEKRDQRLLRHIRERALPALAEMARWKHLPHALPAFILLGRAAGMEEKEIQDAWSSGNREPVIQRALKPPRK